MFAISSFAIILFLYVFGLFGILLVGCWLAFGIIIAMFIAILIKIIVEKDKSILNLYFTKISIVFIGFAIIQFPILYYARPYRVDELSHWALVVKNMFHLNDFGSGEFSTDMFKGYPRGTSLFLYFFQFFGMTFQEGSLYMATNLLNIGFMLPIFSIFEKKINKNSFILCVLCVFIAPLFFFPLFYRYIYVDHYLGIIFGYSLFAYFKDRKLNLFTIINLALTYAVMTLSKNTGIVLSLFSVLIIFIDLIVCRRETLKESFKNKWKILYLIIPVFTIVFAKVSWSMYLDINLQQQVWDTQRFSLSALFQYMFNPNEFQKQVNHNFGMNIINITSFARSGVHYIFWTPTLTFLIIGLLLYLLYRKSKDKKMIISLAVTLGATIAIYLYGLLVAYIFTFNEYEALKCASFYRYYITLPLGIIMFLIYQIFNTHVNNSKVEEKKYKTNRNWLFGGVTAFATILAVVLACFSGASVKIMSELDRYSQFCQTLDYKVDSVYYVNINYANETYRRARYIATPVDACGLKNGGSYGNGVATEIPEEWGDPYQPSTTFEKLQKKLSEEYNYLYLHYIDDEFVEKFGALFERVEDIEQDKFYKTELVDGKLVITLLDF